MFPFLLLCFCFCLIPPCKTGDEEFSLVTALCNELHSIKSILIVSDSTDRKMNLILESKDYFIKTRIPTGWIPLTSRLYEDVRKQGFLGTQLILFRETFPKINFKNCDLDSISLLILNDVNGSAILQFGNLIAINCRFIIATRISISKYHLFEIYAISSKIPVQIQPIADWNLDTRNFTKQSPIMENIYKQRSNLNGLNLRNGLNLSVSPFIEMEKMKNSNLSLYSGITYEIWANLAYYLNISLIDIMMIDIDYGYKMSNGSWSGLLGLIQSEKVDIIHNLLLMNIRKDAGNYLKGVLAQNYMIFIQPPDLKSQTIDLSSYSKPFDWPLWIVVFTTILVISFWYSFYFNSLNGWIFLDSFLSTLGAICLQGSSLRGETSSGRILVFITYLLFYMVIQSYSSAIISSLLSVKSEYIFHDLEGLMNYGEYQIQYPSSVPLAQQLAKTNNQKFQRFYREFLMKEMNNSLPTILEGLNNVMLSKRYGFISSEFTARAYFKKRNFEIFRFKLYEKPLYLGSMIKKNTPCERFINHKMFQMSEVGIITRITKDYFEDGLKSKNIPSEFNQIPMGLVIVPFSLLILGYLLGIFLFFLEYSYYYYISKKIL